jgi:phosphoglycolate phosphatase-like HAD superfamily hydrolase
VTSAGKRRVIIFDFDDTLIVSRRERALRLLEALAAFGCPADDTRLDAAWGLPFRQLVASISPRVDSHFEEFMWYYVDRLRRSPPEPCPGVLDALPQLAAAARLFVHSSSHSLLIRTDLASLGLLPLVEFVCGSDWQIAAKPDPRSLNAIWPLIGIQDYQPGDCVYVGDSASDERLASAAGLQFVPAAYAETRHWGADGRQCLRSMADLLPMISDVGR